MDYSARDENSTELDLGKTKALTNKPDINIKTEDQNKNLQKSPAEKSVEKNQNLHFHHKKHLPRLRQ